MDPTIGRPEEGPDVIPGAVKIEVEGQGFMSADGSDAVMVVITAKIAMRASDLLDPKFDEHEPCPAIGAQVLDSYHVARQGLVDQLEEKGS